MLFFRRVEPEQAGPSALGILIPPGKETLVILRPRSLAWDFLPARWDGDARSAPAFCQFARDEAPAIARQLAQALEERAAARVNPLETFGGGKAFQLWLRAVGLFWIVCQRRPGQAYQPLVFATREEAQATGDRLLPIVFPTGDPAQEIYFNTQKFSQDA